MNTMCKKYLLKKILLRIDYLQVQDSDVEMAVKNARQYFYEQEYQLFQTEVPLTSMQPSEDVVENTNRPIPVSMITETIKEYVLQKGGLIVKFSNRYLIIEEMIQNNYRGSEFYTDIINRILTAIYAENPYMRFQRIGIRKIDSLVFKDLENINKYFKKDICNQINILNVLDEFGKDLLDCSSKISIKAENGNKANLITNVQTGEYSDATGAEKGQAIQVVLDIDMYNDALEKKEDLISYIMNVYQTLNEESYKLYKGALDENFYSDLLEGNELDSNILGGVWDEQFCS